MLRFRTGEILLVALFTGCVCFQLFVPPSIGLANNGDFGKMIGRFSLGPGSFDTSEEYRYFTSHWVYDRSFQWMSDDRSSELIPISAAVLTGWWFSNKMFDIRILGAIHAISWIACFAVFVPLLRPLAGWRAICHWNCSAVHLYRRQLYCLLQFVLYGRGGLPVPGMGGGAVSPLYKHPAAARQDCSLRSWAPPSSLFQVSRNTPPSPYSCGCSPSWLPYHLKADGVPRRRLRFLC